MMNWKLFTNLKSWHKSVNDMQCNMPWQGLNSFFLKTTWHKKLEKHSGYVAASQVNYVPLFLVPLVTAYFKSCMYVEPTVLVLKITATAY